MSGKARGQPGRRARGGRGSHGGGQSSSSKRAAPASSDYEDATPPTKRGKITPPVETRTLPERENRGLNPLRVDATELHATRAKRPNGAKAADEAEKARKKAELDSQLQAAMAQVAAINALQDAAEADTPGEVNHLDDLVSELTASEDDMDIENEDIPVLTINQDDFNCIEDDDAYRSEDEPEVSLS